MREKNYLTCVASYFAINESQSRVCERLTKGNSIKIVMFVVQGGCTD